MQIILSISDIYEPFVTFNTEIMVISVRCDSPSAELTCSLFNIQNLYFRSVRNNIVLLYLSVKSTYLVFVNDIHCFRKKVVTREKINMT